VTIDAVFRYDYFRRMVAFTVEALGKHQHVLGTVLDAESTPFTTLLEDVNLSTGNVDFILI
jgi:hypothetical protein